MDGWMDGVEWSGVVVGQTGKGEVRGGEGLGEARRLVL